MELLTRPVGPSESLEAPLQREGPSIAMSLAHQKARFATVCRNSVVRILSATCKRCQDPDHCRFQRASHSGSRTTL